MSAMRPRGSCSSSIRPACGTEPGSPKPPASSGDASACGTSTKANGFPRVRRRSVGHGRIERHRQRRVEEGPGIGVVQVRDAQMRQAGHLGTRQPGREHQTDRFGREKRRRRRRAPAPTSDPTTAGRRSGRSTAGPSHTRPADPHGQADQEAIRWGLPSSRTPPEANRVVVRAAGRADRASARTTDARRRTPTPSPTAHPWRERSGNPRIASPDTAAAPSCRHRPLREAPALGSHRGECQPPSRRAPCPFRRVGPSTPSRSPNSGTSAGSTTGRPARPTGKPPADTTTRRGTQHRSQRHTRCLPIPLDSGLTSTPEDMPCLQLTCRMPDDDLHG